MSAVTTEKSKTAGAVVDEPVVPVQAGPVDEQAATAEAIAAALDPALVSRLAAQARARGVQLLGRGGVLQQLTRRFLEAALEAEMDEHLGYDKHDPAGRDGGNSRNGKRAKTLLTEVGPVDGAVPRERAGDGGEGAKWWLRVLTEIRNRGVGDVHGGLRRPHGPS